MSKLVASGAPSTQEADPGVAGSGQGQGRADHESAEAARRPSRPAPADAAADAPADAAMAQAARDLAHAWEDRRLSVGRDDFEVGGTEMAALEWLMQSRRTPTELADRLHLTTASVTGLIDRLAADGLVDRHPHPTDRRKILVELTDDARSRLAVEFGAVAAMAGRALAHLDPAHRGHVLETLRLITADLAAPDASATAGTAGTVRAVAPHPERGERHQLTDTMDRITAATTAFARPGRSKEAQA